MGVVLSEVLVTIGIVDGLKWVRRGQLPGLSRAGSVVLGGAVEVEVRRLVDKRSSLGVETGGWGGPEGRAEVDLSEFVGN